MPVKPHFLQTGPYLFPHGGLVLLRSSVEGLVGNGGQLIGVGLGVPGCRSVVVAAAAVVVAAAATTTTTATTALVLGAAAVVLPGNTCSSHGVGRFQSGQRYLFFAYRWRCFHGFAVRLFDDLLVP